MFYFENFRKRKVSPKTLEGDINRYKKYLLPYFEEKRLTQITALECQTLIDELSASGKGKTTDEIYSLMSVIFKAAIAHGLLSKNPLDIVFHKRHEKTHGKALTKEEELKLF
jgi:site-specific recombinase XerD